jgi:hypothetical protein
VQEEVNRAALVVRYPDGHVDKRCVTFTELAISGEELLWDSGLDVVISTEGAVCAIGGHGCPADDCFCHCTGQPCEYWAYYHWQNGAWRYSDVGAGWFQVTDGALEGWSWGEGNWSSGVEPPVLSFSTVCAVTATPTTTSTPSATPTVSQMPPTIPAEAPGAILEVMNSPVTAGTCTILKWVVWGAEQITLDGETVAPQDRREICPTVTRRYVLVAANSAGQVTREITVEVLATVPSAPPTAPAAQATATRLPAASTPTPSPTRPAAPATATRAVPTLLPSAPVVPTAVRPPTAPEKVVTFIAPTVQPTDTPASPAHTPAASATPSATRAARTAVPGRPTSPPILQARAPEGGQAGGEAVGAGPGGRQPMSGTVMDRGFQPAYLPQYAAFALIAAVVLGAAAWVAWKRSK